MTTLKSECRKFSANIFNKVKCQNCFRTKDAHSAEALESNRATRKVSKCGYLFVAPDWDFTVSINRTKRWQRRWFVLYDDGELTYSVDEHPDTVPQAVIDMNKVLEVSDAEDITGNQFAIAITAPEKVHFVKGTSREESRWWFDVLSKLPRNNVRGKHKRNATFPGGKATTTPVAIMSDNENPTEEQVRCPEAVQRPRFLSTSETSRSSLKDWTWLQVNGNDEDVFPTRDYDSGDHLSLGEANSADGADNDVEDPHTSEVELNNALNNLITSAAQLTCGNEKSGAQEETSESDFTAAEKELKEKTQSSEALEEGVKKTRNRRYQKRENRSLRNQRSRSDGVAKMIPSFRETSSQDEVFVPSKGNPVVLLLSESGKDQQICEQWSTEAVNGRRSPALARRRHMSDNVERNSPPKRVIENKRENATVAKSRCTLKKSESLMNISSELSPEMRNRISELKRNYSYKGSPSMYRNKQDSSAVSANSMKSANNPFIRPVRDTDPKSPGVHGELKKSSSVPVHSTPTSSWDAGVDLNTEDTLMKKGWLLRQTLTKEWSRHWFVLKNASLTYYRDPSAEDCGIMDGVLDLNQVTNVAEISQDSAFAFCLVMWDNKKHVLASVSPEVRSGWIKAIQRASNLWDSESRKDFSQDEIILPEHSFHNSKACERSAGQHFSVSSSPSATPELEKMIDLSSSDDQSEYFSIIDEEEAGDRSTSPRTLPPSPPVNRNAMSLVKERSRTRVSAKENNVQDGSDSYPAECSDDQKTSVCQESPKGLKRSAEVRNLEAKEQCDIHNAQSGENLETNPSSSSGEYQDESVTVGKSVAADCKGGGTQSSDKSIECCNEVLSHGNVFSSTDLSYRSTEEQKASEVQDEERNPAYTESVTDGGYKVKYELLKERYIQDRLEWENTAKKEKHDAPLQGVDNAAKVFHKTRQLLLDIRAKLNESADFNVNADAVHRLCEELEKLSRASEKRLKRDNEVKKLRKALSEMRALYANRQKKLEEEHAKNSSLNTLVERRDKRICELQQEIECLKSANLEAVCMKSLPEGPSDQKIAEKCEQACTNCRILKTKLISSREQVKKLKKELKDSHASFDDLEISCYKLKQELSAKEELHRSQMALMIARIDDLTAKYTMSERNLRQSKVRMSKMESRQERRRSSLKNKESITLSKECEAKLFELEQKIVGVEDELKELRRSNPREDLSLPSPDLQSEASENAESDAGLRKRWSQDSTSGSENTGILLRLHTLGTRVKIASDAVERHIQENSEGVLVDKPKICLQLRNDEESIAPDEGGEDWSTLSYTTSLTDLQAIDCLENELPTTWSEFSECLDQKCESMLLWLRSIIHFLQKQEHAVSPENSLNFGIINKDISSISSNVLDVLENMPDVKFDGVFLADVECDTVRACYKLSLINEMVRLLQNFLCCESGAMLEKLSVCRSAFGFASSHLQLLRESEGQMPADINNCKNFVEKVLLLCTSPYESFQNGAAEDFEQVSSEPPSRISFLEKYCSQLMEHLDSAKQNCFSALYQILADVPVQDADVIQPKPTLSDNNFQDSHPLITNTGIMMKEFYKLATHELCGDRLQGISVLQREEKAYRSWCSTLCELLHIEAESVIDDLKKMCPQLTEQSMFSYRFSDTLYRKFVFASVDLARVGMLKAVTQSILIYLSDQDQNTEELSAKEWAMCFRNSLYAKAVSMARGETLTCDYRQSAESLLLDCMLQAGTRETKMSEQLEAIHYLHQKELENMRNELEVLQQENHRLKDYCETYEGTGSKLQELQSRLEQLSKEQKCSQCDSLRLQLQSLEEQHDADLLALHKQHKDKTEELHKHLQLVLEQKDEIHLQEVQKMEDQLQAAQKRLDHLEVEYNEQIQSLRELCEQKAFLKQDPINEESVRRRYQSEIEQLKGLCEKGLTAVENSYRRITTELERRHKEELAVLEAEKDKALQDETQATLTALEVMRRAHAEELQREIAQFKEDFLKKMQTDYQSEAFHQKQESEVEEIKREILALSEKYSVKCLEMASLEERVESLSHQLQEANHQLFDLTARNKQLKVHLALDIAQKKELLEDKEEQESMENIKLLLALKDSQLTEQQEENAQLKQELHLAQMHVSVLDVQCEQLNQSLKSERRLREDEVSSLRARLEAIISSTSSVTGNEEGVRSAEQRLYCRGPKFATPRGFLHRSPSLNLPSHRLETTPVPWKRHNLARAKELLRSPSCPGLERAAPM